MIGICSACSSPENYYSALVSVLLKDKKNVIFFCKCCIKKGDYVSEDIDVNRCEVTSVEN